MIGKTSGHREIRGIGKSDHQEPNVTAAPAIARSAKIAKIEEQDSCPFFQISVIRVISGKVLLFPDVPMSRFINVPMSR